MGAILHEHTPVTGLESRSGRIQTVRTAGEAFAPEQVVLAAGAWSPPLTRPLGLNLPVQPARG